MSGNNEKGLRLGNLGKSWLDGHCLPLLHDIELLFYRREHFFFFSEFESLLGMLVMQG